MDYEETQRALWLQKLAQEYSAICPPVYKQTELTHRDMPPVTILSQITQWKYDRKTGRGLIFQGNTGLCKSRCAWVLIKRLMTQDGIRVLAINDPSFSREYSERLGKGTADDWLGSLCRVPILFVDDFGKAACTPRYKELFYDLLESRTSHLKPIILTTQLNRSSIIERFGDVDGNAIVRRILEFSDLINF